MVWVQQHARSIKQEGVNGHALLHKSVMTLDERVQV